MSLSRRTRVSAEIAPDEIFLDSANAPDFDRGRFEGRLERPLTQGPFLFLALTLGLCGIVLFSQAVNLQVVQGALFSAQSARNSLSSHVVFANRGVITDISGEILASNATREDGSAVRSYRTPGFGALLGYVSYPKKDKNGNYYDTEITGLAGIEASLDAVLAGKNGTVLTERDALGELKSKGVIVQAIAGADASLTVDARAQEALYKAVQKTSDAIPYLGGAGVLMDVATGEIRALVSYPEYDPNILSRGTPSETIAAYNSSARKPYLDRAVAGLYAPGSIVKPFGAVGALTDGSITPEYTVEALGSLSIPNPYNPENPTIFRDWRSFGVIDLRDALAWSSDVYFYILGGGVGAKKGLGIERLAHWYRAFGVASTTGIELPGEQAGFVPTPAWKEATYEEPWRIGNTYHTAIGQYAMQATPIAMVRATAAIANDGALLAPTVLRGTTRPRTTVPASPKALQVVREGMRQAVTEGTAAGLASLDPLVEVAAKTGTAQTGVRNEFYNSWIIGFFPYEKPRYAFAIVMERAPAGTTTGGVYVFKEFMTALFATAPEYFK